MLETANRLLAKISERQDIVFAVFFVIIISILILPLPTFLVDLFLALNISLSLLILISAIYLKHVLEISTFPIIILTTTLLRLALSVATTRLILLQGDAGHLVEAFGKFVVGGNVVVGLVIFFIIAVVQFLVITKGAERIAEVSARFTLDALPGKQMAIDADVRAGELSNEDARKRRFVLEKESQFFGSMDGSMRFVKGDAIAGFIIIFVNLLGGIIIGVSQRGMKFGEAVQLYSLLTVGDGLVAQIPAMFIAVAAGTVVTRVVNEDAKHIGGDISRQLGREPKALMIAGAFCLGMAVVPGFPTTVFVIVAVLFGALGIILYKARAAADENARVAAAVAAEADAGKPSGPAAGGTDAGPQQTGQDASVVEGRLPEAQPGDVFSIVCSADVVDDVSRSLLAADFLPEVGKLSSHLGMHVPVPSLRIEKTAEDISFMVDSVPVASWPRDVDSETLKREVLALVLKDCDRTFSVDSAVQWLETHQPRFPKLVADVAQTVTMLLVVDVVRELIKDGIPIKQPRPVLETLLRAQKYNGRVSDMVDAIRLLMAPTISHVFKDPNGVLNAILLSPDASRVIREAAQGGAEAAASLARNQNAMHVVRQLRTVLQARTEPGVGPALVVQAELRRTLKAFLTTQRIDIPVLALSELVPDTNVQVLTMINVPGGAAQQPSQERATNPAVPQPRPT